MTVEEAIIKRFEEDFLNFRVNWGYNFDYTTLVKGFIPLKDVSNFPTVCFELGHETLERVGESSNRQQRVLKCGVIIYVQTTKERGKMTDVVAQAVSDGLKFIHGDVSITGYGTPDHKVLKWQKVLSDGVHGSSGVKKWMVREVFRPLDDGSGRAEVSFAIDITYFDFHNSINTILS